MDTSKMRAPLKDTAKIFEAGLQSKTWDIHGLPHFVTTMHHKGCNMCEAYVLHVVEALKVPMVEIPSREVKKAFWIAWPTIVCQIEDEASSESDKKVEWYSNHHDNLMDDVRLAEEKASAKQDHCQKADEKLAQANLKITELEAKLAGLQKELTVLLLQDKRTPIDWGNSFNFSDSESEATSGRSSWKRKKGQAFPPAISYGGFFPDEASMSVPVDEQMPMMPASGSAPVVGRQATPLVGHPPMSRIAPPWGKGDLPILVTGMLPRPLRKIQAGGNTWKHTCPLDSPEFKDTLLIARAKKVSECTPEEHMILSHALKHEKA